MSRDVMGGMSRCQLVMLVTKGDTDAVVVSVPGEGFTGRHAEAKPSSRHSKSQAANTVTRLRCEGKLSGLSAVDMPTSTFECFGHMTEVVVAP